MTADVYRSKIAQAAENIRASLTDAGEGFDGRVHFSVLTSAPDAAGTNAIELLASSRGAVKAVSDFFGGAWAPRDAAIVNDADAGAMNAAEFIAVAPIFRSEKVAGWAVARTRVPDFGGWEPGGYSPQAVDRWAEGARIEPVKILLKGVVRREVTDILKLNSRTPATTDRIVRALAETAMRLATDGTIGGPELLPAKEEEASRIAIFLRALEGRSADARQAIPSGIVGIAPELTFGLTVENGKLRLTIQGPEAVPYHVNLGRYGAADMAYAAVSAAIGAPALLTDALADRLVIDVAEPSIAAAPLPATVGYGRQTTGQAVFRGVAKALGQLGVAFDVDKAWAALDSRFLDRGSVDQATGKLTDDIAKSTRSLAKEYV